jgi:hypothetical protein
MRSSVDDDLADLALEVLDEQALLGDLLIELLDAGEFH